MVSKKVIIGIVAVVVVIALVAVAVGGGSSSSEPDARYNYKVELADHFSWTGSSGGVYAEKPDAGMQYAIITYKVINDKTDKISTNLLTWEWKITVNSVSYTSDFDTYSHPGYNLVDVLKGGEATQVIVFQIPDTVALKDVSVSNSYHEIFGPSLKLDTTITV